MNKQSMRYRLLISYLIINLKILYYSIYVVSGKNIIPN